MNYYKAVNGIVRAYRRHEGYNGKTILVGLAYDPESLRAIEVAPSGCHVGNDRRYGSEEEMIYYFDNHRTVHFPGVISVHPTEQGTLPGCNYGQMDMEDMNQ